MNLSGNSVVKAAAFYKILPQNIVVIHDDMDLKITQIKAKLGGGAGGHNGLKALMRRLVRIITVFVWASVIRITVCRRLRWLIMFWRVFQKPIRRFWSIIFYW